MMARESEDEYVCKRCGAKIERRAAFSYNGLCKSCYEKVEDTSKAIY
ncbi:MAG: hypothetical protein ACLFSM_06125 [Thermoplasmata archaeon]